MILVIGATGYIGRYFCVEMTKRGEDILALGRSKEALSFLDSKGVKTQYFDLNDESSFKSLPKEGVEAIIDLSACLAELETPVERFFEVNTIGAYRVLEYARTYGIKKVVLTSSHKVYNDLEKQNNIAETDGVSFTGDHSPYIISKIAAEYFVEYYNKDFDMDAVALRLTGVHGYGEVLGHLEEDGSYEKSTFEIFFEKILKGEAIEVWGDQTIKRDHIYIKDVVSALLAAVRSSDAKGVYNIATSKPYSQLEEAEALIDVFSGKKRSKIVKRPEMAGLKRGYSYCIDKAKRDLHWSPEYTDLRVLYSDYKKEWEKKEYRNYHFFKPGQEPATL